MAEYSAKDHIRYAIVGAIIGYIAQLICTWYIKTHPELFSKSTERRTDNTDVLKKQNSTVKKPSKRTMTVIKNLRGGAFRTIPGIIPFLSRSGIIIGIVSIGAGYFVNKNFINNIYSCSPQNLPIKGLLSNISPESILVTIK